MSQENSSTRADSSDLGPCFQMYDSVQTAKHPWPSPLHSKAAINSSNVQVACLFLIISRKQDHSKLFKHTHTLTTFNFLYWMKGFLSESAINGTWNGHCNRALQSRRSMCCVHHMGSNGQMVHAQWVVPLSTTSTDAEVTHIGRTAIFEENRTWQIPC